MIRVESEELNKLLFPYKEVRSIQDDLIKEVDNCLKEKKNLIVHAPTGLGKTAATLPVALAHALKNKLTVFFLTSRHTQHRIVIDTLKQIKKKYKTNFVAVDIIGKKWMCPVPGTNELYSNEFSEYCKHQREKRLCEFYNNARKTSGRQTVKADKVMADLKEISPCSCEETVELCTKEKLCPYEISAMFAKQASVIIADYYMIFHPSIRQKFFNRAEKELSKSIIIIDEGHNLPKRIRDVMTAKLSNLSIHNALKEAKKFNHSETAEYLEALNDIFKNYLNKLKAIENKQQEQVDEILISKEDFTNQIKLIDDYDTIITNFEFAGDSIREIQKKSYVGTIATFLEEWLGPDEQYTRILSKKYGRSRPITTISYRCMDPSLVTKEIIENSYSTIIMSGTLTPTAMYQDLLGFENPVEREYQSPFPRKNKLSLIIPETTTKFTQRGPEQYKNIARITSNIVNLVPGNIAMFFPSYQLRDDVYKYFEPLAKKTIFLEESGLSKVEKEDLLERFKSYNKTGAVLLGVAAGSFGEGIDLPGDLLKAVIVVGLPLQRPDLETKELIDYYEKKFNKGWDYGYIFPAITRCLQSAGRCIRSETDRGVVVFLDERFAWPHYSKCFPPDWNIKITKMYEDRISEFFD